MATNNSSKNRSKVSDVKTEVKISLSYVAKKLRDKELFPDKLETGKQFFRDLDTEKA